MAFAQLRIAHDLRDDPIRMLDLLLDNSNLLGRDRFALLERPLQREGRVVDNGQRVLDLVRKLRRHAPRRAQLAFPHRELVRLFHRPPLPFQQDLHSIAADRHQQQEHQPQGQGLGKIVRRPIGARVSRESSSRFSAGKLAPRGVGSGPASLGPAGRAGWRAGSTATRA